MNGSRAATGMRLASRMGNLGMVDLAPCGSDTAGLPYGLISGELIELPLSDPALQLDPRCAHRLTPTALELHTPQPNDTRA